MNRFIKKHVVALLACLCLSFNLFAVNIYIDKALGCDTNSGESKEFPLQSMKGIVGKDLSRVDSVLLKSGQRFSGTLEIKLLGQRHSRFVVSTYGGERPAIIDAKDYLNGILVHNTSNILIENLKITADAGRKDPRGGKSMRCGILLWTDENQVMENVTIRNVEIEKVFYEDKGFKRGSEEVITANGTQNYGWGIRGIVSKDGGSIGHVSVENCKVRQVSHTGIKFTGNRNGGRIHDLRIMNCDISETGGPGMQFSCVDNAYIAYNKVFHSGSEADSRNWGRGSGMWTWSVNKFLIEHNSFVGANGPGDSAGAHIDYNCKNVLLQYNFSADNAGGFVEILGNCHNCSYRYNISVNDGFRIKGENGAFQEGKTLWLSGFVGDRKRNGPYNSYIYNNTIYVSKNIDAKMALENTASGALIANNIFYIEGSATVVPGDQYTPEKAGESETKNVFIDNNLYLHKKVLPKEYVDRAPCYASPHFVNAGGYTPGDYIPLDKPAVMCGKDIQSLPGDSIGLIWGLEVEKDFFGNPIHSPFMGAIGYINLN